MIPRSYAALAGALVALGAARPLRAQAAADTAALARALAAVLSDSLIGQQSRGKPIVWLDAPGALNAEAARILGSHPAFRGPIADPVHTTWMNVHRVTSEADTARVVIEFGRDYGRSGFLTFWTEQRAYLFTNDGTGWRFVRSRFIEHADGGGVRG